MVQLRREAAVLALGYLIDGWRGLLVALVVREVAGALLALLLRCLA